ncbi:MAG: nuclear transport factor 2 family protein [Candidatus Acidiferrum sp.]
MTPSRSRCFITLLAFCVTTCCLLAETPGQKAGRKNAASTPATLQSILEQREKAVWDAFNNKDSKAFADLLADDYTSVSVDGTGECDKRCAVNSMGQVTLLAYSLSEFKLNPIGANAALLRYRASANFPSINGKSQVLKLAVGDVWVKRGECWESLRYEETETK